MRFASKPEAYAHAIFILQELKVAPADSKAVAECVENIKQAFENHLQEYEVVCHQLDMLVKHASFNSDQKTLIADLIYAIRTSPYEKETIEQKFKNPLTRRAESELPVALLKHPTTKMMQAVENVSTQIVKTLNDAIKRADNETADILEEFTVSMGTPPILFGSIPTDNPDDDQYKYLEKLKNILEKNDHQQLPEILFIHFKWAISVSRYIPVIPAENKPCGELVHIVEAFEKKFGGDFFKLVKQQTEEGYRARAWIADFVFCNSPLYLAESQKGRIGLIDKTKKTSQLGLLLPDQVEQHGVGLGRHSSIWTPDCIGQQANFQSQTVCDLLLNDTPYVSGPSGMTSLLLGQMEFMGNLATVDLKKEYAAAVVAYIAGGGFHCAHEVIGPAEFSLKLFPGYKVQPPDKKNNKTAPPPNYHVFYQQLMQIDKEFAERRDQAWKDYLIYIQKNYVSDLLTKQITEANNAKPAVESKSSTSFIAATLGESKGDSKSAGAAADAPKVESKQDKLGLKRHQKVDVEEALAAAQDRRRLKRNQKVNMEEVAERIAKNKR